MGLLPAIGHGFGVAESTAGLLVSLYAVLVAVLAVPLTLATRRIPGKRLLLLAMGSYVVSNAISALAPSLAVLAAGRALGGVTHALFFSVFIGYVTRLVPPAQTGRALALASAGAPAGFVLGVPLATALGNAAGWRATFAALAALMAVVLCWSPSCCRMCGRRLMSAAPRQGACASWPASSAPTPWSSWVSTRFTPT